MANFNSITQKTNTANAATAGGGAQKNFNSITQKQTAAQTPSSAVVKANFSGSRPTTYEPTAAERILNTAAAAARSTAASVVNTLGTLSDASDSYEAAKKRMGVTTHADAERATMQMPAASGQRSTAELYDTADRLQRQSAQNVQTAKQGLGKVGSFAVDTGVALAQLGGDIAAGALTGGGALAPMAVRAFGSGAQEARQSGATLGQQVAYGAGSAALSVATEKIANTSTLMQKAFGKSTLASAIINRFGSNGIVRAISAATSRLQQTAAGRLALSALSEGGEEFVEAVVQPVLQRATYDKDASFDLGQALYDAAIGGTIGLFGGGADVVASMARNAAPNAAQARTGASEGNLTGEVKMPTAAVNEATEGIIVPPAQNAEVQATVERGRSDRPLGNNATQEGVATDGIVAQNERMSSDRLLDILLGNRGRATEKEQEARNDGLGGADAGTLNTSFQNMQAQSDEFHPINENAAQREAENLGRAPEEVPTVNPFTGQDIGKTVSTILNSEITSNEMAPVLEKAVANGRFDAIPVTDAAAMAQAQQTIQQLGGYKRAASDFVAKASYGRTTKNDFALGVACYNEAVASKDNATAFQLADTLAGVARTSAQVTQAVNLFNRLTPAGKLLTLKSYLRKQTAKDASRAKTRKSGAKEYADKLDALEAGRPDIALDLDEDLATAYLMAETDEARAAAWQDIISDIASKMPPTLGEKWNFWRYTAMLTNPVTHVRNTVGNTVQDGLRRVKNMLGVALEQRLPREQRTKSLLTNSETDTALKSYARELYEQDRSAAMGAGKYSDTSASGIAREIQDARKMFGQKYALGKAVQAVGDMNTRALEWEDAIFNSRAYVDSLAQALKAKGITYEMAVDGKHQAAVDAARAYAIREAAKATYRDSNAFSDFVSRLGRASEADNGVEKGARLFLDAMIPFRRTPANILVRGAVDYSPLGIAKAAAQVRRGDIDAAEFVDALASGLTGTGVLALGAFLTANGLLHVKAGDDDREEDFLKASGYQDFALQLGDASYTLDWLVPAAMPLFAGSAMMTAGEENGLDFVTLLSLLGGSTDVVLETSMLQSIDTMLDNMSYADNKVWFLVSTAVTSYLSQAVPTVGGKVASALDDTARKAYTQGGKSDAQADASYFAQSVLRKIPGGREQLQPSIDLWGREISNGGTAERFAEAFVSPGFFSTADTGAVTQELQRLAGAQGSAVYPSKASRSFTVNGETKHLTADEYTAFAKNVGQTRYDILETLLSDSRYKAFSDADKADVIADVYEYANAKAKADISEYEPTSWVQKAMGSGNAADYIISRKEENDAAAAAKEEKAAAWEKTLTSLKPYGVTQSILDNADKNGGGVNQAELYAYLSTRGDLDAAARQMIWNSVGGWKTSYQDYAKKHK